MSVLTSLGVILRPRSGSSSSATARLLLRLRRAGAEGGGGVSQDKSLTYTSYLALEEILGAQRPKSDEHDEILSSSSTR